MSGFFLDFFALLLRNACVCAVFLELLVKFVEIWLDVLFFLFDFFEFPLVVVHLIFVFHLWLDVQFRNGFDVFLSGFPEDDFS